MLFSFGAEMPRVFTARTVLLLGASCVCVCVCVCVCSCEYDVVVHVLAS